MTRFSPAFRLFSRLKKINLDYLAVTAFGLFSFWLMFWTFQYRDGQMVMLGRVWSDFAAHVPLIRSFSMGANFPPEYPTFPGEPIRYHYLFFLIVAVLEKIGFNIAIAMNIPSFLGMWLLLSMIYFTTLALFKSRLAALLAVVLFLFNSSFSILEIVKTATSVPDLFTKIVTAPEYASFGPWDGKIVSAFWNWNIYLNQRHLAASFGLALLVCYPLLRKGLDAKFKLSKWWYPVIYIVFITFPLFHQAAYIMSVLWCIFWSLFFFKRIGKKLLLFYGWCLLFSLFTHFGLTQNSKQHAILSIGYLAKEKTAISIATYWLYNLGAYVFIAPIAWLFSRKAAKIFLLPFAGFFVLANVFLLSTDMINNHKLINFAVIGLNIITAGFLINLCKKHFLFVPFVIIAVLMLTASGIADIFPVINNHFLYVNDFPRSETQQWIRDNTPRNTVFLSNEYIYNPASLVGRKLFLDYGYFNWSMGYEDGKRRELLKTFYSNEISKADLCKMLLENNINYVHLSNVHGKQEYDIESSTLFTQFTSEYQTENDEYIINLMTECNN